MDELKKELSEHLDSTRQRIDNVLEKIEKGGSLVQAVSDAEKQLTETRGDLRAVIDRVSSASKELGELAQSATQIHTGLRSIAEAISNSGFGEVKNLLPEINDLCRKLEGESQKTARDQWGLLQDIREALSAVNKAVDHYHKLDSDALTHVSEACRSLEGETRKAAIEHIGLLKKVSSFLEEMAGTIENLHRADADKLQQISGAISKIQETCNTIEQATRNSETALDSSIREVKDGIIDAIENSEKNRKEGVRDILVQTFERIDSRSQETQSLIGQMEKSVIHETQKNRVYVVASSIGIAILLWVLIGVVVFWN